MAMTGLAVLAPQLALYYQATGRFLVSSYGSLGFNFTCAPDRWRAVQRSEGRVLLVAAAAGCSRGTGVGPWTGANVGLEDSLFLVANTYLIASWWDWQFGGSYGHRGFVDGCRSSRSDWPRSSSGQRRRRPGGRLVTMCADCRDRAVGVQMIQYWNRVLPMSDTTWEQYRSVCSRVMRQAYVVLRRRWRS